jgi:hypothetical protein
VIAVPELANGAKRALDSFPVRHDHAKRDLDQQIVKAGIT